MTETWGIDAALRLLSESPAWRSFGFSRSTHAPDSSEVELVDIERWVQPHGVIHGGVLSALADTAAVARLYVDLPRDRVLTSIEFKLNFLRGALVSNGPLSASAELVRAGRRVQVAEVSVRQGERELARGLFTYIVLERENK